MSAPITNAKDVKLTDNVGTLPNMQSTLLNYYQPMTLVKIGTIINELFEVEDTPTNYNFRGVIQPLGPEELKLKPEGSRSWTWLQLHTDTSLELATNDVVVYQGMELRVMKKVPSKVYGYLEFHLCEKVQAENKP